MASKIHKSYWCIPAKGKLYYVDKQSFVSVYNCIEANTIPTNFVILCL